MEIFCNFKQRKVSLEECAERCAKCLPAPIIRQLAQDFIYEDNRYGVTELVGCIRRSWFFRTSPTYPSLGDLYVFGRGLAFHYWFQKNFGVRELKLIKRFSDFDIVGMPDAIQQNSKTLFEFKSVNYIPVAPYPQHKLQIQAYFSLAKERIEIEKLVLIYFTMNNFRWFEVEPRDIMELLKTRAELLHKALKGKTMPQIKESSSLCSFCSFKIDCELGELKGR